ncbi:calcium-binding and coiled-coil domain-containing protein 2-like [Oscarella lobularis]|uniref:calcium-binding and coiled-coil domain-containing protein 2-like n=1 Tax=Oscarella lobularis TaxID=121494 RepID=UPI0033137A8B
MSSVSVSADDKIRFDDDVSFFPPKFDVHCIYKIIAEAFVCGSRDWIALCPEKNQSEASKSYFTWQWADASKQKRKTVVFPAKHLPEDLNSYVFVYIDGTGATIGTSKPFRFGLPSDATEDITTTQYESLVVVERPVSTQNSGSDDDSEDQNSKQLSPNQNGPFSLSENEQLKTRIIELESEKEHQQQYIETLERTCQDLKGRVQDLESQNEQIQHLSPEVKSFEMSAGNTSSKDDAQLKDENEQLKQRNLAVESDLKAALEKVRLLEKSNKELKTKKRHLEKALVTERLQYDRKLEEMKRQVGAASDSEDDDYVSAAGAQQSLPTSLEIRSEDSSLSRKDHEKHQSLCPICGCQESLFSTKDAFISHVDSHFDN